jgi:hypothetical protein
MSVEEAADRTVTRICGETFDGLGLISTDSVIFQRYHRRKLHTFLKEQERLRKTCSDVFAILRSDGLEAAVRKAEESGFADSVAITVGRQQLRDAVAARFRDGDNAWAEGFSDERTITIHFWHDPSHRRVM